MSATLAFELSTTRGELAVVIRGEVIFREHFQAERSHNAQLFAPLGRALAAADREQLSMIVVGTGPGSYTGVRIAIAAAHGVALSRGVPIVGWPSITAPDEGPVDFRVVGDARRGCYYLARVVGSQLAEPIEILDAETTMARLGEEDGRPWLTFDAKPPLGLSHVAAKTPSAARLAEIVASLPEAEIQRLSELPLEPRYLQEAFITTAKKAGKLVPPASASA